MNNSVLLILTLILLAFPAAEAREVERTTGLRQDVFEEIQEIQELIENDAIAKAQAKIKKLQEDKLSDYELAQSWFLMGYAHYRREDYSAAVAAYEKVLKTDNLPLGMKQNVLRTLSQLSVITEDYENALAYLEKLLAISEEPLPENFALKAQVLYQMERIDESLAALEKAIRLQAKKGGPPRENWLLLKNAILYQREDYPGMLAVAQQLVELYPKDRYLVNMAAIHGEMGNTETQLALLEPLYERESLVSPAHKINLASLYIMHGIPYKAAVLLDRELNSKSVKASEQNLEMLAQAWLMSANTERALAPLAKAAALSDDGNDYVNLARIHMNLSHWEEAERSLRKALEKGKLHDPGGAHLMLGMVHLNQKNFREARREFARAGQNPKSEKLSRQWLDYLEREEERARLEEATSG